MIKSWPGREYHVNYSGPYDLKDTSLKSNIYENKKKIKKIEKSIPQIRIALYVYCVAIISVVYLL